MKSLLQETRSLATGFVLGALVLGGGSIALAAWTAPTGAPPTSNIALPVNTSSTTQYKGGALGIGGLLKAYLGIDANNNRITAVATPTDGTDAVNKDYVDAFAQGGGGGGSSSVLIRPSKTAFVYTYPGNNMYQPPTYAEGTALCVSDYGSGWEMLDTSLVFTKEVILLHTDSRGRIGSQEGSPETYPSPGVNSVNIFANRFGTPIYFRAYSNPMYIVQENNSAPQVFTFSQNQTYAQNANIFGTVYCVKL